MITPFLAEEGSLLVRLLIAHFVADFLLQSDKSVKNKELKYSVQVRFINIC